MNKPQIFISHSSEESNFAIPIKNWIDEILLGGVKLFVSSDDGESIPLGTEWLKKIKESLENSSMILVLVSHVSKDRKWIYFESGGAYIRDIPVIPICIGGLKKNDLPIPLNLMQAIEFPSKDSERLLLERIAASAGLRCPKTYNKLPLPEANINSKVTSRKKNNIESFSSTIYLSQVKLKLIDFFKTEKKIKGRYTLTEIEEKIELKGLKKRRYILETLEEFLKHKYVDKIQEKNTYWQVNDNGLNAINGLK